VNEQKGSKPIPLETGGVTVTSVVEEVTLDRRRERLTSQMRGTAHLSLFLQA
jgi:hypothetical protein